MSCANTSITSPHYTHSVNNAHEKQEEYATDIEKFLNLIQTLEDHKAELTNKVETLTMEKTTMEAEMEDCAKTIQRLKDTIGSQELSQEDVRRMQREKDRLDVQIEKQNDILNGHLNMLKEAEEKWSACFQLLERTVQEYNSKATDLELIPEAAKHAKGKKLEVILDQDSAAKGAIQLMGGVDVAGAAKSHVEKFVKTYDREILTEKRRMIEVKENVEAVESSGADLAENIDVSLISTPCLVCQLTLLLLILSYLLLSICFSSSRRGLFVARRNAMQNNRSSRMKSKQKRTNLNDSTLKSPLSTTHRALRRRLKSTMLNTGNCRHGNRKKRRSTQQD
jgi:hypothetical protein